MPRRQKMEVGGLNIRLHPHSDDRYRQLFKEMFKARVVAKVHGDRYGMVTSLSKIDDETDVVHGVLSTFLKIDTDGGWFNTATLKEASDEDLETLSIPENLRPNVKIYRFYFDVKSHKIAFEHYSDGNTFTHSSAQKFFDNLFRNKSLRSKFGDVKVSIIQQRGGMEKIFSIPRITDIDIFIAKPNSDIWDEDFEEQLESKNARSMRIQFKAERGQGIKRDKALEMLIRASLENGHTEAKGYGANGHETVSTESYPKIVQDHYEEDTSPSSFFQRLASQFIG